MIGVDLQEPLCDGFICDPIPSDNQVAGKEKRELDNCIWKFSRMPRGAAPCALAKADLPPRQINFQIEKTTATECWLC